METEKKETGTSPLLDALRTFSKMFSIEAELVKASAEHHNVSIFEGDILRPITERGYNPRVPNGTSEEIDAIKKAEHIAFICEDYRQSLDVVQELKPDIVISIAGGPVQPDYKRLSAMVNLIKEIKNVNVIAQIDLVTHNGICGGCKHFTNGENVKIREKEGVKGENNLMKDYMIQIIDELSAKDVDLSNITLYRADIDDNDKFTGITEIPFE